MKNKNIEIENKWKVDILATLLVKYKKIYTEL